MIIYEREHDWVMIPQHHHGLLSGDISRQWNSAYIKETERWSEVTFAIAQHDRGWTDLDETPFWNDRVKAPYSFIDFPLVPRLTFYKKGIDEVERQSPYAGLLCSLHYCFFLVGAKEMDAIEFSRQENARQHRLMEQLNLFGAHKEDLLNIHLPIIQFCDALSLYLCMQEPGTPKTEELPWFKDGFRENFPFTDGHKIIAKWINLEQVSLRPFPLSSPAVVSVKVREVKKENIRQRGIAEAYRGTEWKERTCTLI
ncbi:DUF3891 family protein [Domibacillus aminovorans]|uniref:Uncharacterized protein n=1 Tax=Domibacillus aminovorans TaxID=29332 RepID=A0A177L842_9BACI|nr:DUF3891 family protein [Domibacillus aminovorans]OAH61385.1 hypothetical protein AWH49_13350 [Domibacillus aminovorans]